MRKFAVIMLFCMSLIFSGCTIGKNITDVSAHKTKNNYKLQTVEIKLAPFYAWAEWKLYDCKEVGDRFVCEVVKFKK